MTLHADLLEQAKHLASREPNKPKQASLRRAVSAAYYALFHLLTSEAALKLAPTKPAKLRLQIRRAFQHGEMKSACELFGGRTIVDRNSSSNLLHLISTPLEQEIIDVASTFVDLQQARHMADYDHVTPLVRANALLRVAQVEKAFARWKTVRTKPNADVFLASLLFHRNWRK